MDDSSPITSNLRKIQVKFNFAVYIEELLKLMTKQHPPNSGEMIYYITKYHIKHPLNIHSREESSSKKELSDKGDIAHFDAVYSGRILYEVEEACKYSKANKNTKVEYKSENT